MKDFNHIEALLERYYDAQTSETEERMLKDFFLHEEVPAHLLAEKEMFLQLQASAMPEGLEEPLSQSIDRWGKKHRTLRKLKCHITLKAQGSRAVYALRQHQSTAPR